MGSVSPEATSVSESDEPQDASAPAPAPAAAHNSGTITAAVIGGGPIGLTTLKNLREAGIAATCFEARDTIGGIWAYDEHPETLTVLRSTVGNISKYKGCYTDFPPPDDAAVHMDGVATLRYLEGYADAFGLREYVELGVRVEGVVSMGEGWELTMRRVGMGMGMGMGTEKRVFDKVVFCTGRLVQAKIPDVVGRERYRGKVLHSQGFKRPEDFTGQKVMVVGIGNTGADVASDLVGVAEKIYVSHRGGQNILSRWANGRPLDLFSNRRKAAIGKAVASCAPGLARKMVNSVAGKLTDSCFELDPAWGFKPAPFLLTHAPIVSEAFVDHLRSGALELVPGVRRFVGGHTVELENGTKVEVDAVIFCTGYSTSFSLAPDLITYNKPSEAQTHDTSSSSSSSTVPPLARLYKNIFSPEHPDSIAFTNNWQASDSVMAVSDLVAMAITQVFAGNFSLPRRDAMEKEIDAHHAWVEWMADGEGTYAELINKEPWMDWLHCAAGTGVNENLGYGWQGWKFWATDRVFCDMLMTGIDSPHIARLFDGRRKKWVGARDALVRANEDLEVQIRRRRTNGSQNRENGKVKKT